MFNRLRSMWLAGGTAFLLVVAFSGVVAAATVLSVVVAPDGDPGATVADTSQTFEDADGNGVDDDCQEAVEADPDAAAAAEAAVDTDGDGTISVTEAAHSDRTGGTNCNHGGYVSMVAEDLGDDCQAQIEEAPAAGAGEGGAELVNAEDADEPDGEGADEQEPEAACDAPETEEPDAEETAEEAPTTECTEVPAPEMPADFDWSAPGAHGAWVANVAGSLAVGGKNCNHGGAVSEAAHEASELAAAAREAAKAEREAVRAAAKAERAAARDAKTHGNKGKGKGHGG